MATEAAVADPRPLPRSFQSFRHAVFAATRNRNEGVEISATVDARPVHDTGDYRTLTGTVVDVHQSLVDPVKASFAVENSLVLEVDGERVTVGGPGAFIEEYEARSVRLDPIE
jgi:hypothetical protein